MGEALMPVEDREIIKALRDAGGTPMLRLALARVLGCPMPKYDRPLDRQLQRLKRDGQIRYQPVSPGSGFPKGGWLLTGPASPPEGDPR